MLGFIKWLDRLRFLIEEHRKIRRIRHSFMRYERGDIVWVEYGFAVGSELRGTHPGVIVSFGDTASNSTVTVIPLTSRPIKIGRAETCLGMVVPHSDKQSTALIHQIRTVSKLRILPKRVGHLDPDLMRRIDDQMITSFISIPGGAALAEVAATSRTDSSGNGAP